MPHCCAALSHPPATGVSRSVRIQLWVVPENPILVERLAPLGIEVSPHTRPLCNTPGKGRQPGQAGLQSRHGIGEGVTQACPYLEQREVGIGEVTPHQMGIACRIALQHLLEITEKLGQPLFPERFCPADRFLFLVLIVQNAADGMMHIMDLGNKVGERKL